MTKEERFNLTQHLGLIHPLTCCGYNGCNRNADEGILIAKHETKLECPCGLMIIYGEIPQISKEHLESLLLLPFITEEQINTLKLLCQNM